MDFLGLICMGLTVFRLSELFAVDYGPLGIFFNLRSWLNDSPMDGGVKRFFSDLVTCMHCSSVIFAIIIYFGLRLFPAVFLPVIYIGSIAAFASLLIHWLGRKEE